MTNATTISAGMNEVEHVCDVARNMSRNGSLVFVTQTQAQAFQIYVDHPKTGVLIAVYLNGKSVRTPEAE